MRKFKFRDDITDKALTVDLDADDPAGDLAQEYPDEPEIREVIDRLVWKLQASKHPEISEETNYLALTWPDDEEEAE